LQLNPGNKKAPPGIAFGGAFYSLQMDRFLAATSSGLVAWIHLPGPISTAD